MKISLFLIVVSFLIPSCTDNSSLVSPDEVLYKTELVDDVSDDIVDVCGEISERVWEYRYIEQSLGTILIQNSQDYIFVTFTLDSELNRIQKLYLHLSRNDYQADNFDSTSPVYMANITDKSGVQSFTFKVDRKYLDFPVYGTDDTYNDGYPFYFASHGIVKTDEITNNEPWYKSVQYAITKCELTYIFKLSL